MTITVSVSRTSLFLRSVRELITLKCFQDISGNRYCFSYFVRWKLVFESMAETIESGRTTYLHIDGFLFYKHSCGAGDVRYWRCRKQHECSARATTIGVDPILVERHSNHTHVPNREEVAAMKVIGGIRRKAREDVAALPVQILRDLQNTDSNVLAELPDRHNITKRIQRERLRGMPTNPRKVENLGVIPDMFRTSLEGENFLVYDSFENGPDVSDVDDDEDGKIGRVLIFATKGNLRLFAKSEIWFVDGTFKTAPSIFYQLFVIMGSVSHAVNGKEQVSVIPLVYALLENKRENAYKEVLEVVLQSLSDCGTQYVPPRRIMSDFELAIINACTSTFSIVSCCLFHLCKNIFGKVQSEGLQERYNDKKDRSIKEAAHMMGALAFVPPEDVLRCFNIFRRTINSKRFSTSCAVF